MKFLPVALFVYCIFSSMSLFAQTTEDLWALRNKGLADSAFQLALPMFEKDTNNTELELFLGMSYADKYNFERALPLLLRVENKIYDYNQLWKKAWALIYLADCYFARGEYDMTMHLLTQSIDLRASEPSYKKALRRLKEFGFDTTFLEWQLIETPHFLFHLPPKSEVGVVKDYTDEVESVYDTLNKFFNVTLPKKIDYFVWNTYRRAIHSQVQTMPGFCIVNTDAYSSIGYGIARIFAYHVIPVVKSTALIDYGTGVYFRHDWDDKIDWVSDLLRHDTSHTIIHIKDLWSDWKKYGGKNITFILAGAFVQHLLQTAGKEKFMKLLENQTYENAKTIYGDNIDTMIADFENKVYAKE